MIFLNQSRIKCHALASPKHVLRNTYPKRTRNGGSFQAGGTVRGKQQLGPMQLSHSQEPVGQTILQFFVFFLGKQ